MTQRKKVCHLSTVHPHTDIRIFVKECTSLANAGYEVLFVVPASAEEIINDVQIVPIKARKNRLWRILAGPCEGFFKAMGTKAELVHFHDPELLLLAPWFRIFGRKVIYDSHEDVPRQIRNKTWLGPMFIRRIVAASFSFIEWFSVLFCNSVISVTPEITNRFPERKRYMVRNYPILGMYQAATINKPHNEIPVVIYSGALTRIRGIREMIQAVGKLNGKVKLLLLGKWVSVSFRSECEKEAGWKYVSDAGFAKPEMVASYYHKADIGISTLHPDENYKGALVTKVFEYMASGLPVIMSDFPYWQKHFTSGAVFVDPMNPEEIAAAIHALATDPDRRKSMGAAGLNLVLKNYSWEHEEKVLLEAYEKLIGRP